MYYSAYHFVHYFLRSEKVIFRVLIKNNMNVCKPVHSFINNCCTRTKLFIYVQECAVILTEIRLRNWDSGMVLCLLAVVLLMDNIPKNSASTGGKQPSNIFSDYFLAVFSPSEHTENIPQKHSILISVFVLRKIKYKNLLYYVRYRTILPT